MKVLITGSAGFVGKKLCERLKLKHEIFGISRRKSPTTTLVLDLTSQQTEKVLGELNPDVIIHCAALTNVDYCETHQDESYKNNVYATKNLVEWANKNNKKIIYISTDYVYSGQTNNYDEKSETNPLNIYGKTKLEAENIVRTLPLHAILRTTVVFGYDPGGLNFLMQLLNLTGPRKIPKDQISNPTDIAVLGDYIEHILNKNINGLYVATGPTQVNRFDFACLVADVFNLNKYLLEPITTAALNQTAQRPLNNGTNSINLRKLTGYSCPSLVNSLQAIQTKIQSYKNR